MSKYHDDSALASDPIPIRLSRPRLRRLYLRLSLPPQTPPMGFQSIPQFEDILDEHLSFGDTRAAVVYSADPLLIAAYTDELDCSILLSFPDRVHRQHGILRRGDRLLTVNTYFRGDTLAPDVWNGASSTFNYQNFYPVIADFFTEDTAVIESRKKQIDEKEWLHCLSCASTYATRNPDCARDGDPIFSHVPV